MKKENSTEPDQFGAVYFQKIARSLINLELIDRCKKRDRKAQNELYQFCYRQLISVCWRYSNSTDDALELMNTGFLKIVTQLDKYKQDIPFEMWARRVMINSIIDEYRKSKQYRAQIKLSDTYDQQFAEQSDNSEEEEELIELIRNKLHLLPPITGKVFNLYAIDGYKHREIAELLQMSEGTSMWHYSEARKKLRAMIHGH